MSLINDALKRAGSAPPPLPSTHPETAPPPMQPVVERKRQPVWPVVLLPLGLVLVFALGGVFLWKGYQAKRRVVASAHDDLVTAREPTPPPPSSANQAETLSRSPERAVPAPEATVAKSALPANARPPTDLQAAQTDSISDTSPSLPTVTPAPTKSGVTAPASGSFPAMKLQGIVYRPSNPSVVINNKTLFIGETIGEAKVVAIDRTSVTVECRGQTRVLTLP